MLEARLIFLSGDDLGFFECLGLPVGVVVFFLEAVILLVRSSGMILVGSRKSLNVVVVIALLFFFLPCRVVDCWSFRRQYFMRSTSREHFVNERFTYLSWLLGLFARGFLYSAGLIYDLAGVFSSLCLSRDKYRLQN